MMARESLYIISDNGSLVEYLLEPCCDCEPDKITDDTELRLQVTARSRWPLTRSHSNKEMIKLNSNHLLSSSPGLTNKHWVGWCVSQFLSTDFPLPTKCFGRIRCKLWWSLFCYMICNFFLMFHTHIKLYLSTWHSSTSWMQTKD